jgi:lysophospholipase L1-like esterase
MAPPPAVVDYPIAPFIFGMDAVRNAVRDAAGCLGIQYVDHFTAWASSGVEIASMLKDELHPNDKGYRLMFDTLCHALSLDIR